MKRFLLVTGITVSLVLIPGVASAQENPGCAAFGEFVATEVQTIVPAGQLVVSQLAPVNDEVALAQAELCG
jgi:hypothetical protein